MSWWNQIEFAKRSEAIPFRLHVNDLEVPEESVAEFVVFPPPEMVTRVLVTREPDEDLDRFNHQVVVMGEA